MHELGRHAIALPTLSLSDAIVECNTMAIIAIDQSSARTPSTSMKMPVCASPAAAKTPQAPQKSRAEILGAHAEYCEPRAARVVRVCVLHQTAV
jgi:hypothetical protein